MGEKMVCLHGMAEQDDDIIDPASRLNALELPGKRALFPRLG